MLNLPLVIIPLYTVAFGMGTILLHFGVFVEDLANIIGIVFRFLFYFSGIFYDIETKIQIEPYSSIMLYGNPIACLIHQFRLIFFYGQAPEYIMLLIWFVGGILLTIIGVALIHKYEDGYAKIA